MNRGQFPPPCCRPHPGDGPVRLSGRTPSVGTSHHIMCPTGSQPASRTKVSLGVRGHIPPTQHAHSPPKRAGTPNDQHQRPLTTRAGTRKRAPAGPAGYADCICRAGSAAWILGPECSPNVTRCGARIVAEALAGPAPRGGTKAIIGPWPRDVRLCGNYPVAGPDDRDPRVAVRRVRRREHSRRAARALKAGQGSRVNASASTSASAAATNAAMLMSP